MNANGSNGLFLSMFPVVSKLVVSDPDGIRILLHAKRCLFSGLEIASTNLKKSDRRAHAG